MRRAGNRFPHRSGRQRAPRAARPGDDALSVLRRHSLFSSLPKASIEQLASFLTKRSVERGTTIFHKGDAGNELIAVLSGSLRISSPGADGREAVLNVIR